MKIVVIILTFLMTSCTSIKIDGDVEYEPKTKLAKIIKDDYEKCFDKRCGRKYRIAILLAKYLINKYCDDSKICNIIKFYRTELNGNSEISNLLKDENIQNNDLEFGKKYIEINDPKIENERELLIEELK